MVTLFLFSFGQKTALSLTVADSVLTGLLLGPGLKRIFFYNGSGLFLEFGQGFFSTIKYMKSSEEFYVGKEWVVCILFVSFAFVCSEIYKIIHLDRVKRIWYLSPMRAAKVQASLRIRAVSPEPSLLAHTSSESRGTFRQKARSVAPLNGWACSVEICHDGMLEDTNSLDGAHLMFALTL